MSRILSIAHTPPTTVMRDTSVAEAVAAMVQHRVGAVAVVEADSTLCGIFTERDLMVKVVDQGRDPAATSVAAVMTSSVDPLRTDSNEGEALRWMTRKHFRHMPVCDEDGRVLGILSIRNLLQQRLEAAADEVDSLEAFLMADGPGG